jgi:hypothetical protein
MDMEHRWNDIDVGKAKDSDKNCPGATLFPTNPTWTDLGANPDLGGENPATNRLSYGTV